MQSSKKRNGLEKTDLNIKYCDPAILKPNPNNTRRHGAGQIGKLTANINVFGMIVPVLVDNEHNVVAGHARVEAAIRAGLRSIPTILIDHLTPAQLRAFSIADNRLHDLGEWNEVELANELKALSALDLDFSMELTGFEVAEIDTLVFNTPGSSASSASSGAGADEDAFPMGPAVSRVGDLWQLRDHRILCGNSLEAASYQRLLNGKSADMVFSDPPYGVAITGHASTRRGGAKHREFVMGGKMPDADLKKLLLDSFAQLRFATKPGAVIYSSIDWRHSAVMQAAAEEAGLELLNIAVWAKSNAGMGSFYRSAHEFVLVLRHPGASHRNNIELGRYGRNRTNVWHYPSANDFGRGGGEGDLLAQHPTPKPIPLVAGTILDATAPREVVLDNFLGSGSTIIAAERTGRICFGIELDPAYVDVAVRRWQKATGEAATGPDGRTFEEIGVERAGAHD
jgi:DNA modification methylase